MGRNNMTNRMSANGLTRRGLLKGAAATAAASALTIHFPAVHGQEAGTLKIGWVSAMSGPGALFGEATNFVKAQLEKLFAGGLEVGGKVYSVEVLIRDGQSSVNVAGQ